jgi:lipopolysaccharide export system protein LptA
MKPHKLFCVALVAAGSAWLAAPSLAQAPAARDRAPLPGMVSNSKDPINIDADKLEVFDREQKAVFIGNVVAVQGDSTLKASRLTAARTSAPDRARGLRPRVAPASRASRSRRSRRKAPSP